MTAKSNGINNGVREITANFAYLLNLQQDARFLALHRRYDREGDRVMDSQSAICCKQSTLQAQPASNGTTRVIQGAAPGQGSREKGTVIARLKRQPVDAFVQWITSVASRL